MNEIKIKSWNFLHNPVYMIDDDTLIVGEWMTGSAKRIKILKSKTESMLEKNKYFSTPNFTAE